MAGPKWKLLRFWTCFALRQEGIEDENLEQIAVFRKILFGLDRPGDGKRVKEAAAEA